MGVLLPSPKLGLDTGHTYSVQHVDLEEFFLAVPISDGTSARPCWIDSTAQ